MPRVRCAQCDKPVDHIEVSHRLDRMTFLITVWCHGNRDVCEIPEQIFVEEPTAHGQMLAQEGVAFPTNRIEEDK